MKPQHQRAYDYIRDSIVHKGFSPSVQELADVMGFKSKNSAALIIDKLIEEGVLRRRDTGSRQLQLTTSAQKSRATTVNVPLVGVASCGPLMLANENIEATIAIFKKPPVWLITALVFLGFLFVQELSGWRFPDANCAFLVGVMLAWIMPYVIRRWNLSPAVAWGGLCILIFLWAYVYL